eukprot:m.266234 g.266234  ORF g.266234 m.266234 type:complete len:686 (+) comp15627_c0_seq57:100-2157(+)
MAGRRHQHSPQGGTAASLEPIVEKILLPSKQEATLVTVCQRTPLHIRGCGWVGVVSGTADLNGFVAHQGSIQRFLVVSTSSAMTVCFVSDKDTAVLPTGDTGDTPAKKHKQGADGTERAGEDESVNDKRTREMQVMADGAGVSSSVMEAAQRHVFGTWSQADRSKRVVLVFVGDAILPAFATNNMYPQVFKGFTGVAPAAPRLNKRFPRSLDAKRPSELITNVISDIDGTIIPREWRLFSRGLVSEVKQATKPNKHFPDGQKGVKCLCFGAKGAGKSTFARYLVNSLLSTAPAVAFLDTDLGQAEVTPAGLVSVSLVSSPLFGSPFTHLQKPDFAKFMATNSPKDIPIQYLSAVKDAYSYYRKHIGLDVPLIINTQGWVKGLGAHLLADILSITNPTSVVEISVDHVKKNAGHQLLDDQIGVSVGVSSGVGVLQAIASESTNSVEGADSADQRQDEEQGGDDGQAPTTEGGSLEEKSDEKAVLCEGIQGDSVYTCLNSVSTVIQPKQSFLAIDLRGMATAMYLLPRPTVSILAQPTVSIALDGLTVLLQGHCDVTQVLRVLNASIVGLCCLDDQVASEHAIQDVATSSCQFKVGEMAAGVNYRAHGLVRAIDEQFVYVITPQSATELEGVNCVVHSLLTLPQPFLSNPVGITPAQPLPYVTSEYSHETVQGKVARPTRKAIGRHR